MPGEIDASGRKVEVSARQGRAECWRALVCLLSRGVRRSSRSRSLAEGEVVGRVCRWERQIIGEAELVVLSGCSFGLAVLA
jgi:hypothetical protein